MELVNKIEILDCTLRDGGYVNNWAFDNETALAIRDGLYDAGVRYIELGIMGTGGEATKSTKFSDFSQVEPLLVDRKEDCHYAIMVTQAEAPKFEFPVCSEKTVDLIRIAFFKEELMDAISTAKQLKEKGYLVFMQAMATFMYSEEELNALVEDINKLQPDGFYLVDSFSTLYTDDIRYYTDTILSRLDKNICFGLHAHNNLQMAYANCIEFFSTKTEHMLIADGSIYGMGRGAGNVPLELLMEYLNKKNKKKYDIRKVLTLFQSHIKKIYEEYGWGYSAEYYLTASKDTNSVYGWYLTRKGIKAVEDFDAILDLIPDEKRYTLDRNMIDDILQSYLGDKDD